MIIAIDGNEANLENKVGVNRFAFEVIWGIYRLRKKNKDLGIDKFLIFLSDKKRDDLPPATSWWQYEVFGPKKLWTWRGLVKRLYSGKPRPDVLYSPSHYGPGLSPIPYMTSIMDLGFLQWPSQFRKKDFFQLKHFTKWSAKHAKRIIAISEFTKKDIVKNYKIDPEKIIVAYPGFTKSKKSESKRKIREIKGDYIFSLGTLKPSKNIDGLIDAYHLLLNKKEIDKGIKLVIAGKKGWLYQSIFKKVKGLGLEKKVIFTDFIPDKEAESLMGKAKILVIPSFWEGFGIPALEAMTVGIPVVCSDRGSLPEVVGKAAIIINPNSKEEIAEGIKQALNNQEKRKELIKLGKKQVKLFSWQNCSRIILNELISYENW